MSVTPAHEVFAMTVQARLQDLDIKTLYVANRPRSGWYVDLRKTALVGVRVMQSPRTGDLVFSAYTSFLENGRIESLRFLRWYSGMHLEVALPRLVTDFNDALGITALSRELSNPFSLKG